METNRKVFDVSITEAHRQQDLMKCGSLFEHIIVQNTTSATHSEGCTGFEAHDVQHESPRLDHLNQEQGVNDGSQKRSAMSPMERFLVESPRDGSAILLRVLDGMSNKQKLGDNCASKL
jgi:hypothetical protein